MEISKFLETSPDLIKLTVFEDDVDVDDWLGGHPRDRGATHVLDPEYLACEGGFEP